MRRALSDWSIMLDKKTLYVVYLLHRASSLCIETPQRKQGRRVVVSSSPSIEELRLQGYLFGSGRITESLDVTSLVAILNEVGKVVDHLPITRECRAEFPRTVRQFNRNYRLWLNKIESSCHS
ncbi:hypothetical protein [Bacteroides sp. 519]|uniref:hypothetical protein n=1 Tax=Bacteroides sp. 519 TaxID=2302937 RepID=UPI0013D4AE02|nr:hypothetical protein [Bacteroides sp. 519]NDV60329.1 hypothetical protein [Bacteroides sp. 519]